MLHSDNHDQMSSSKNHVDHHYYSLSTVPLPQPPHPSNSSQSVVNIPAPKSDFHRPLDDNLNSFIPFGSVFDLDDSSCIHFRTQSHNTELVLQRIYKYTSTSSSSSDRSLLNSVPTTIQKILKFEHAILPDIHFFQDSRNLNHIVCTLISANGVVYRFNWFKNESLFESMTTTNVLNMVQCFPLVGRFNHLMVPLSCYSPHPDGILIPCSDGTIVKCSLPFYTNLEYSADDVEITLISAQGKFLDKIMNLFGSSHVPEINRVLGMTSIYLDSEEFLIAFFQAGGIRAWRNNTYIDTSFEFPLHPTSSEISKLPKVLPSNITQRHVRTFGLNTYQSYPHALSPNNVAEFNLIVYVPSDVPKFLIYKCEIDGTRNLSAVLIDKRPVLIKSDEQLIDFGISESTHDVEALWATFNQPRGYAVRYSYLNLLESRYSSTYSLNQKWITVYQEKAKKVSESEIQMGIMVGKDVADIYLDFVFSSSNSSSLQTFSNEMIRNAIINFASQSQNQSSQSYNGRDIFSSDQNTVSYIPSTRSELKSYITDCVSSCVKLEFVGNSDTLHYHKFQNDIRATWDRFVAYLLESYFELSKPLSIMINSNMDESIMIVQRGCLSFLKTIESVETLRLVENGVIGIGELESSLGNGIGSVMKNEAVKTDINSFVNFCAALQQMGIFMTNEELMTFLGSNRNDIVGTVEDEAEMLFTRFSFTSEDVFGWENLKLSAMQFDDIKGFVEQVVRLIIDTDLETSQTGNSETMERSNQTSAAPTEITTTLLLSTLQSCIQNRLRIVNILMVLTYFVILIDRSELEIGFTNVKQTLDDLKELFRWYYFLGRVFKIQVCVESGNANVGVRKLGKDDTNVLLSNRMEGLSLTGGKPSNRYGEHETNFGNEYTSVLWNTLFGSVSTGVKLIPLSPSNIAQASCQLLSLLSSVSFHSSSQKAQLGILKNLVTYFDVAIVNENDVRDLLEMCEYESWVWYLWGRYYLVLKEFEKAKDCFEMAVTGISGPGIDTHLTDDVNLLQVLSISPTPSVTPSPLTSSFTTPLKPPFGSTSGSSFGSNVKMNDFYSNVITLFEEKGYSEGVITFAKYALESVDCENISSKREVMIDLYQLIFTHSLHIQDYDGAYTAMTMNPDPNSQERCLSSLVTTMCQRSASNKLVKFPFVGLQSNFSNELRFKARNMKSLELLDPEEPNYFDIGFNWFVGMGDFRSAALLSYQYARKLNHLYGTETYDFHTIAIAQATAYLEAINTLGRVDPTNQWLVLPVAKLDNGKDMNDENNRKKLHFLSEIDGRVGIISLKDVKKEYAIVLARLELESAYPDMTSSTQTDNPNDAADAMISLYLGIARKLSVSKYYDKAISLSLLFDRDLKIVFDHLVATCLQVSKQADSTLVYLFASEHRYGKGLAAEKADQMIQKYLSIHDSAKTNYRYHFNVLERMVTLDNNWKIPAWLKNHFIKHHADDYIKVMLKHNVMEEAVKFVVAYLDLNKPTQETYMIRNASSKWLPHSLLNQLLKILEAEIQEFGSENHEDSSFSNATQNTVIRRKASQLRQWHKMVQYQLEEYFAGLKMTWVEMEMERKRGR